MTWTTEDSLAMVRHYLGYELWQCHERWFVRKGDDHEWEPLPHFPNDREETFRCLEAWGRYHPGVLLEITMDSGFTEITEEASWGSYYCPTLIESLLRMLLAEALAAVKEDS